MAYLIDGYNLLHALGLLHERAGPTGLEKARLRLIGLLRGAHARGAITVVFDSGPHAPDLPDEQEDHGIHIRFSKHPEKADDVIEHLIRRDSAPRQLTVVSDDHRVQQAARRRQCRALGCLDFVEELDRARKRHTSQSPADERAPASSEETRRWLEEFGEIANDPEFKQLSEPKEFQDIDPDAL
jgi:predicted RNA-binding protein with PIN domain